jgi:hypothetical protein
MVKKPRSVHEKGISDTIAFCDSLIHYLLTKTSFLIQGREAATRCLELLQLLPGVQGSCLLPLVER